MNLKIEVDLHNPNFNAIVMLEDFKKVIKTLQYDILKMNDTEIRFDVDSIEVIDEP